MTGLESYRTEIERLDQTAVEPINEAGASRSEIIAEFDRETEAELTNAGGTRGDSQLVNNAILLAAHGELRLARSLLIQCLQGDPQNLAAISWMAKLSRRLGDEAAEQRFLSLWCKLAPSAESLFELGNFFFSKDQDGLALKSFQAALTHIEYDCPLLFEIYKNIGNAHLRMGDLESAEENYNKAFVMNPDSDTLLVNYGTLELQRQDLASALERFRQAASINSRNDRAWVGLAMAHRSFGDFELSWANLEMALDLNPTNGAALDLVADWGVRDFQIQRAIERYERFLSQNQNDVERSFCLAKLYYLDGKQMEARLEMDKVLALDPGIEGGEEFYRSIFREVAGQAGA